MTRQSVFAPQKLKRLLLLSVSITFTEPISDQLVISLSRMLCFPDLPAAGRLRSAGCGDLGECGRRLFSPAPRAFLQPRDAVHQRGVFLHLHRGCPGAAGTPGLLRGPQAEQVSAAHGRFITSGARCVILSRYVPLID